jgi:hypothetical protein
MAGLKDRLLHPFTRELPAHTEGVHEGNARGNYERQEGHLPDGTSTAQRSTGVNSEGQNPIDPRSPNLSPP